MTDTPHDPGNRDQSGRRPTPVSNSGVFLLGAYLVVLSFLLTYLAFEIWPTIEADANGNIPDSTISLFGGGVEFTISAEAHLILLVMVISALGSYIHTATSFATFVGNRRIYKSWVWWYILRVFIGVPLALIFYFVLRGGLLSAGAAAADVSPFGIAAVSGLVGMFSKQATDKLREVFDNLFRTDKPDERGDKLEDNPVPEISSISFNPPAPNSPDAILVVSGIDFIRRSIVRFDGVDRATTWASDTQLIVSIQTPDLASLADAQVTVFNPPPGGGISNSEILRIQ